MFSIDQNCHSLWDAVPKLQALARAGQAVRHFIEDIDVAFAAVGAGPGGRLTLKRERYYHSGGADWGAAMFYSDFLGRLPADIRQWEGLTGVRTAALARKLGRTPESLYDEFSPGDNWQLVGPSYVGDRRHHRIVADLTVAETAPFLRQLLQTARSDMLERFVAPDARDRLLEWFGREERLVEDLLARHEKGLLIELYRSWMERYVRHPVSLDLTSSLFAVESAPSPMLDLFLNRYEDAAALYNQAIREGLGSPNAKACVWGPLPGTASPPQGTPNASRRTSGWGPRPLDAARGELPFFGAFEHEGHLVRAEAAIQNGALTFADKVVPLGPGRRVSPEGLRQAGVRCLAGKAIVLVIDVRLGERGQALALPYHGSVYMPTANRLAELLMENGLLKGPLRPIVRVRFRLLDRMKSLTTTISLPEHLAAAFGRHEITAGEFAETYPAVSAEAAARLEALKEVSKRETGDPAAIVAQPSRLCRKGPQAGRLCYSLEDWRRRHLPDLADQLDRLNVRRRALAKTAPKSEEIRQLWKQAKEIEIKMLQATIRQIDRDTQVSQIDYWDSRGAILPWSVGLGGESFYNEVLARAEIYEESSE